MSMGVRIRSRRGQLGLSQEEVEHRCGVARNSVLKWERGSYRPSAASLAALCSVLKTSADYLLGLREKP